MDGKGNPVLQVGDVAVGELQREGEQPAVLGVDAAADRMKARGEQPPGQVGRRLAGVLERLPEPAAVGDEAAGLVGAALDEGPHRPETAILAIRPVAAVAAVLAVARDREAGDRLGHGAGDLGA